MVRFDLYAFVFRAIFIIAGALTALVSIDFRAAIDTRPRATR